MQDQLRRTVREEIVREELGPSEKSPSSYPILKRAIDVAASAALLLLLSPMLLLIAIVVAIDSKGPIIFAHDRVGAYGRTFRLYKFRTMQVTAPKYSYKIPLDDQLITGPGKWLRRTGLDELPQLYNVLRGDMSLVGPRPELPFIVSQYQPWQHQRHVVRPGITGWWQVSRTAEVTSLYGDASDPTHLERFPFDLYYVRNVSLMLDIQILARTAVGLLGQLLRRAWITARHAK